MKVRNIMLMVLAITLLCCTSCQKTPYTPSDGEITEPPEPQYMAYRLSEAARVGDDIYFVGGVSFAQIFASEYGTADFEIYVPCFNAVCDHTDRSKCCIETSDLDTTDQIVAFLYDGEPAMILFNPVDICFSRPYSNIKINLMYEEVVNKEYPTDVAGILDLLETLKATPKRSEFLVYGNYLYYVEMKNGVRTQYRISLGGGEPERIFEEDNIIIRTIINDKLFGIRYENVDPNDPWEVLQDRDNINYFRSDMNYENIEPLPEKIEFFALPGDDNFVAGGIAILDADEDYIYFTNGKKVWALHDSDIYAEPILLSDMGDIIPYEVSIDLQQTACYSEGSIYAVVNFDMYQRSLLDSNGYPTSPTQWYGESMFYCFDIKTGEYRLLDISNDNYIMTTILYSDGKYVYGEGSYAHDDGRGIQGVTMRLTLDTMRYEVILPEHFTKYSAETAS